MSEAHHPIDPLADDLPPLEHDPLLDSEGSLYENGSNGEHAAPPRTAGGVIVVRAAEAGARVAVLESGGLVSLPKAEAGPGMSAESAAHRAAEAFLGQRVRLAESVGETLEHLEGEEVATWFWLARPTIGASLDPGAGTPPGFHLHWIDLEEAEQALSSEAERHLMERLRGRTFGARRRPFASLESRQFAAELEAFRDESAAAARSLADPEAVEALLRAKEELERAEGRLARGDAAGARRARARAEREVIGSLDEKGRALALERALARAPEPLRSSLGSASPGPGEAVSAKVLLAVQTAVDAAVEERERGADIQRAAQLRATAALVVTTASVLVASGLGVFSQDTAGMLSSGWSSFLFAACGLLGGWVGESLFVLREHDSNQHLALPLTSATGALAGLAVGAILSGGFASLGTQTAALLVSATFAAGWIARLALPRGTGSMQRR